MLTEFGKLIRKLRLDRGLRLYDMAKDLGKSSAWLSYIETGKQKIPMGLADEIADFYSLSEKEREDLNRAAAETSRSFKLTVGQDSSKIRIDTAYALARKFETIDDETLKEFLKLLKDKK